MIKIPSAILFLESEVRIEKLAKIIRKYNPYTTIVSNSVQLILAAIDFSFDISEETVIAVTRALIYLLKRRTSPRVICCAVSIVVSVLKAKDGFFKLMINSPLSELILRLVYYHEVEILCPLIEILTHWIFLYGAKNLNWIDKEFIHQ